MTVIAEWSATVAFGAPRPHRNSLLASTALGAAFLCMIGLPASAQPAPNARPVGEQVVAGTATVGRTSNATTINQSSQRAAINWHSFDVGGDQTVTFNQPSAS